MVRPPLVGQASSSSNESRQSTLSGTEDNQEDIAISPFSRGNNERYVHLMSDVEDYYLDQNPPYLSNREDYIIAKPPEGSSDQSIVSINTAEPCDILRNASPSSSVTSSRPLEWDSGADVGYQQHYLENVQKPDQVLSTIERLAIVQGNALLRRSDPEGTTEPMKVVVKQKQIKEIDSVGLPKAHSTPFHTISPNIDLGSVNIFSPIGEASNKLTGSNYQTPKIVENANTFKKPITKYPLFPELTSKKQTTICDSKRTEIAFNDTDNMKSNQESLDFSLKKSSVSKNTKSYSRLGRNSAKKSSYIKSAILTEEDLDHLKKEDHKGNANKKLSSSLEDIRDADNLRDRRALVSPNTLPRSQSQSNIHSHKVEPPCSTRQQISIPFPATIKSASSSSVATVVQKKNDSPLHYPKAVQTSLLRQSVGVQAFDSKLSRNLDSSEKRSSYFQHLSENQAIGKLDYSRTHFDQCNEGAYCKGAHKKVVSGCDPQKVKISPDGHKMSENSKYQESTLDSIESSSKSRGFSTDIQGSIAAEDRVNSFEYLPGYIYETEKQKSSLSLSSTTPDRKTSLDIENLWDSADSINLTKDINRGVEIIKDVVRNKNGCDNEMKKKVIQLVVEKLINTDYPDDGIAGANINANVPWVPPVVGNVSDTRFKKQDNMKVPSELASLTDTSRTTSNISSECFKPKPRGILRDANIIETETSSSYSVNVPSKTNRITGTTDGKSQILQTSKTSTKSAPKNKSQSSVDSVSSSSIVHERRHWREAVTKSEQLYEQRRQLNGERINKKIENKRVIQFLDMEKKTQLMRIDVELQHLNNLRKLLSKTEALKENLKDLRKDHPKSARSTTQESTTSAPRSQFSRKISRTPHKVKSKTTDESTPAQGIINDWSSHHYFSEDSRSQNKHNDRRSSNYEAKSKKHNDDQSTPTECPTTTTTTGRGKQSQQESSDIGVQTSTECSEHRKVFEQERHSLCKCCKENRCNKQPLGYYITFQPQTKSYITSTQKLPTEEYKILSDENGKKNRSRRANKICSKPETEKNKYPVLEPGFRLQDYLTNNRPEYIHRANNRRQCIAELAYLRELREHNKRSLLQLNHSHTHELPPPPLAVKRVFSQKKMRQQTERKYKQLAEVQSKQQDEKRKEAYRTNRLMAEVFNKKLQKRTLKGDINLSNSVSVITTL